MSQYDVVISGTGLWTPSQSITNDELVASLRNMANLGKYGLPQKTGLSIRKMPDSIHELSHVSMG